MMTTDTKEDLYTFEITSEMLTKKFNVPYSQARLHLISFFKVKEVIATSNFNNKLKPEYFKELIKQVNRITFGLEPLSKFKIMAVPAAPRYSLPRSI
ncbi:MAG: hypothetical protein ACOYXA_01695 [Bacteroidota bacterium]